MLPCHGRENHSIFFHCSTKTKKHPHTSLLAGEEIFHKTITPEEGEKLPHFRYEILGMKELYLDFGSSKTSSHPIHKELSRLKPGDTLQLEERNKQLELTSRGISVARLSKSTAKHWQFRLQLLLLQRLLP